jgi:hypothetical protein
MQTAKKTRSTRVPPPPLEKIKSTGSHLPSFGAQSILQAGSHLHLPRRVLLPATPGERCNARPRCRGLTATTPAVRLCYLFEAVAREPFPVPPPWRRTTATVTTRTCYRRRCWDSLVASSRRMAWMARGELPILSDFSLRSDLILQFWYLCFLNHFAS